MPFTITSIALNLVTLCQVGCLFIFLVISEYSEQVFCPLIQDRNTRIAGRPSSIFRNMSLEDRVVHQFIQMLSISLLILLERIGKDFIHRIRLSAARFSCPFSL